MREVNIEIKSITVTSDDVEDKIAEICSREIPNMLRIMGDAEIWVPSNLKDQYMEVKRGASDKLFYKTVCVKEEKDG